MTDKPAAVSSDTAKRPAAKRRLGKGLGALLGEAQREETLVPSTRRAAEGKGEGGSVRTTGKAEAQTGLRNLPVTAIEPLPGQPRRNFDEAALDELAQSIAARGVIQPVIVTSQGKGKYRLVAGERRWRAAQKARLHEIPALVRDLDRQDVLALALIENLQREDLNPIEEARAYRQLAEEEDLTQAQIAKFVDKSRSHVANLQRLLALPETVLGMVESGELSMGHARAIIGADNPEELAREAVAKGLSVRDVEKAVRSTGTAGSGSARRTARTPNTGSDNADIAAVQRHLEEFLGLPVKIKPDADPKSGSVTIRYTTLDQLDLVCQRLTGGDI